MLQKIKERRNNLKNEVHAQARLNKKSYSDYSFLYKFLLFWYYLFNDLVKGDRKGFKEYGLTVYTGRQGYGKTVAMSEYLERMRRKYPGVVIVTNYGYEHQTKEFEDWHDLVNVRSENGVIFAIDELQNEFSAEKYKNFPEFILSEITQQRKQKVKIVATSQVFTRLAKQLREQAFEVVECRTLLGRWTFTKCFDAFDYESIKLGDFKKKELLPRKWRRSFIQTDDLRSCYDTYAKIAKIGADTHKRKIEGIDAV